MNKHLLLTLAASIAFAGVLVAEEAAKPAAAPAAKAEAKAAPVDESKTAEAKPVAKNDAAGSMKAGLLLLDAGKFAEAADFFQGIGVQSHSKREASRQLNLSSALIELGKYDEGAAAAQKAIDLDGANPKYWNNLAAAKARDGKRDEAIAIYTKAIAAVKAKNGDTSKLEANLTELTNAVEAGKPKKVKEAEAKAKAAAEKAAAKAAPADVSGAAKMDDKK